MHKKNLKLQICSLRFYECRNILFYVIPAKAGIYSVMNYSRDIDSLFKGNNIENILNLSVTTTCSNQEVCHCHTPLCRCSLVSWFLCLSG